MLEKLRTPSPPVISNKSILCNSSYSPLWPHQKVLFKHIFFNILPLPQIVWMISGSKPAASSFVLIRLIKTELYERCELFGSLFHSREQRASLETTLPFERIRQSRVIFSRLVRLRFICRRLPASCNGSLLYRKTIFVLSFW